MYCGIYSNIVEIKIFIYGTGSTDKLQLLVLNMVEVQWQNSSDISYRQRKVIWNWTNKSNSTWQYFNKIYEISSHETGHKSKKKKKLFSINQSGICLRVANKQQYPTVIRKENICRMAIRNLILNSSTLLSDLEWSKRIGLDFPDLPQSCGERGSTVVKVLCYKSEGRWFDPSWCHWIFHWHKILPIALRPWGPLSL